MKMILLSKAAKYSKHKIDASLVSLENFVTTDNILQNKFGVTTATSLPLGCKSMPSYQSGNILVGNIRPYLKKIWYANRSGGNSPDVLVFDVNKEFDSKFVYYSLFRDDFFIHMMKGSKGTKMPRGNKDQILDFLIPDFELLDQQKIASVLSALDAKIDLNNQINAELEKMAKTIYDYWFVQFDFPDENGKPYKSSGGKMLWNEQLKREIPDGWKDNSLWEIAKYYNGLAMQKNRPTSDDYLPVIKIKEMNEGFSEKTEKARADISSEAIVNDGDVLFSWSATLDVKIWSGGKGALNQHIFKVTSNKYPKTFYYFELRNYLEHFKMMADNRKTTMGHITQDHLKQSRIAIPPVKLIEKLDSILAPILTKQLVLHQENQELVKIRDWLLPMLMNGQVKVN